MNCSPDREVNVQSVYDKTQSSRRDWLSITITTRAKFEDFSVRIAITESLDGIETRTCLEGWPTTSIEELVGMFLRESQNEKSGSPSQLELRLPLKELND